jgi:hypothetical protein
MIGFIADVHVGNHRQHGGSVNAGLNDRCRSVLSALCRAKEQASAAGCTALVVLGDLFDTDQPNPQMIAAVGGALVGPLHTQILMGNHDRASGAPGDHALGWARQVEMLDVVEFPQVAALGEVGTLLLVPFRPGDPREWLPDVVADLAEKAPKGRRRVLCVHLGLRDAPGRAAAGGRRAT